MMKYYHEVSILNMGYLVSFVGVYLGTLYRKNYHGLERIDYDFYEEYLMLEEYDPLQKPV